MHSKKQTSMALDCTPDLPNHPLASHLLFGLRSAPPTRSCFLSSPAGHDSHVSGPPSTIHKPNTPPRCAHLIRPSPLVLPQLLTPTASATSSCLPSPSRPTVAINLRPSPAVSFLALPVSPSPPRKRNEAIPKLVLPAVSAVRASIARSHRRTLSVQLPPRSPSRTPSYCEKMLRLSLARDEHAQTGRSKPSVFDASFSPDGSVSSSSSQKSSQASGSRSPSPAREPSRRMSPSPTRIRVPRSNTVSHTRSTSQGVPTTSSHLPRSRTHPSDLSAVVPQSLFRRPSRNRNEEVLRSRLEGVLSSASSNRDISCPPSPTRKRAATSGDSFGLITPPHTLGYSTLPIHPSMTRSKTSPAVSRSSRAGTMTPSPITPPPSPPFDANRIALQLRDREGYVSFADVQGLGIPDDDGDVDDCDPERGRGRWWSLWKG